MGFFDWLSSASNSKICEDTTDKESNIEKDSSKNMITSVSSKPKTEIDCLLDINIRHSRSFMDSTTERRRYRGEHPTEMAEPKCVDVRLHLPVMTQTTFEIIQPFRSLGGIFNLGWSFFQAAIDQWVEYSISRSRQCLIFVAYHYTRGDTHRSCRGFGYNTDATKSAAIQLKQQFDSVYDKSGSVVPIVCGIETDLDALVLHGENGQSIDLTNGTKTFQIELEAMLRSHYPSMPKYVIRDFIPLVLGNIKYIAGIRISNKPIEDAEHKEWVLGDSRGFDWLHLSSTAFIAGPFDPSISAAIKTAAKLLKSNIDEGRIDPDGVVFMTLGVYRDEAEPEYHLVKEKIQFLSKFTLNTIKDKVLDLTPNLQILTGFTDLNTRKFEMIERLG